MLGWGRKEGKGKGAISVGSCHFPVRLLHSSADQSVAFVHVTASVLVFLLGNRADSRAPGIRRQRSSSSLSYSPYLQHRRGRRSRRKKSERWGDKQLRDLVPSPYRLQGTLMGGVGDTKGRQGACVWMCVRVGGRVFDATSSDLCWCC